MGKYEYARYPLYLEEKSGALVRVATSCHVTCSERHNHAIVISLICNIMFQNGLIPMFGTITSEERETLSLDIN